MKAFFYLFLILNLSACKESDENKNMYYEISGEIQSAPDSVLVFISNEHFKDSTLAINGHFSFRGQTDQPRKAMLSLKRKNEKRVFWLENSKISISGKYDELNFLEIQGGENQTITNLLWNQEKSVLRQMNDYGNQITSPNLDSYTKDSLSSAYQMEATKLEEIKKRFVWDNPNTLESAILLSVKRAEWNRDSVGSIFSRMNKKIQDSKYGKLTSEYLELRINPQIGDSYIDFSLKNNNDETVSLSQLKGNFTLIDFWASWCKPCRQENPNLIELYNKYHTKGFQIIGASMDRDKDKWIQAIKKDSLPWANVIDLVGPQSNNIFFIYNVKAIPDNVLINPDGIVIARNIRGVELKKSLEYLYHY